MKPCNSLVVSLNRPKNENKNKKKTKTKTKTKKNMKERQKVDREKKCSRVRSVQEEKQ